MFTSPQNLYVEGLPPDVMELGGGALRGGGTFLVRGSHWTLNQLPPSEVFFYKLPGLW